MSMTYVALGLMAFIAMTSLAIDVGHVLTARSQAQNAADAGALAGATALVFDSFNDRSATGPAVRSSIETALQNQVMAGDVKVEPADVTFPVSPGGASDRVRVNVFRTAARGNELGMFISQIFGFDTADISASATGQAAPANAMTCVKPFMIPDRWVERNIPPNNTFNRYNNQGQLISNPDIYYPPGHPQYAGYRPNPEGGDIGKVLMIRAGQGNQIEPGHYFSWKMPGDIGANFYEENISGCNPTLISMPYTMIQEPGAMAGPTGAGIDALIAKDPNAYWDGRRVQSTMSPSPRVFPIPMYDPDKYQAGMTQGRGAEYEMTNWVGFFVESRSGQNVYGRIVPLVGVIDPNAPEAPDGVFPRAIRLVE